jgi:endonuclease III
MGKKSVADELVRDHGQTFAEECGIELREGTAPPFWQLLCASVLYSARISAAIATRAARRLREAGLDTPERMRDSSREERVRLLDEAGYARYDERTAITLGDLAARVSDDYRGDLHRLREEAGRDPDAERSLLKQSKGVGDVGVDIFFREAQVAWDELRPFADRRALQAAESRQLGSTAKELERLVGPQTLPRLVAALVRVGPASAGER